MSLAAKTPFPELLLSEDGRQQLKPFRLCPTRFVIQPIRHQDPIFSAIGLHIGCKQAGSQYDNYVHCEPGPRNYSDIHCAGKCGLFLRVPWTVNTLAKLRRYCNRRQRR